MPRFIEPHWRTSAFATLLGLMSACAGHSNDARLDAAIKPDPAIQAQIERIVEAMREDGVARASDELKRLKELAGDGSRLVEQVALYFRDAVVLRNVPPMDVMTAHFIYRPCIPLDIDDPSIVRGLWPFLDSEIHEFVEDEFTTIDGVRPSWQRSPVSPPNYEAYRRFLQSNLKQGDPIPDVLAAFIYRRDAGAALLAFVYAHEDPKSEFRDVLWAEHIISDAIWKRNHQFDDAFENAKSAAIEQLEKLSDHEEWWVRLYVAEILQQRSELRTPQLTERIRNDQRVQAVLSAGEEER